jgi:hypothetical protein
MNLLFLALLAAQAQPDPPPGEPSRAEAVVESPAPAMARAGTPLRLMVWNEVSTRSAKPGDRFLLVLDSAVSVGGQTIIPRGAKAWGEVVAAKASGMAGRSGKLETKLLHIEVAGREVPIAPASAADVAKKGEAGTLQVVLATVALTPWGPFARGNNARLKAGHMIEAVLGADVVTP